MREYIRNLWRNVPPPREATVMMGLVYLLAVTQGVWSFFIPSDGAEHFDQVVRTWVLVLLSGGWVEGDTPFDIWLEAEVPASTPVLAVFGDSLSSGVRAERPVADSPISLYAFAHNSLPVHYSASGDTMTSWIAAGDAGWKVNRWDGLSKADALLFSMGSNDVFANVTLSGLQGKFAQSLALMSKRVKDGAPVYLTTILPRTNKVDTASVTSEAVRRQYNTWLKTQKGAGNVKEVFDIVPAVSSDDETLMSAYDMDGVHLNTVGYKAIADTLNLPPMPAPVAAGAVAIVDNGNGTATISI
ncbi:SGNH/GDSL hydrolase family protein [Rothia terrae]|uniref:SGNH/GDSL hydrolase family protein n=1 Tax=Rothia terrae TaxID=396015 RepID=UPI00382D8CB3